MDQDQIRLLLGSEMAQRDPNFLRYSVPRKDLLSQLSNFGRPFIIINAARGSGKSGLLLSHKDEIQRAFPQDIVIDKFYADIALPPKDTDVNQYISFWKNTIMGWIVAEIGKRKGFAATDDMMLAVEKAEKSGEKPRNPVSSLTSRLKIDKLPLQKLDYDPEITGGSFRRLTEAYPSRFWILLDEMDDHYTDSRSVCLVSLMQATQYLTQRFKTLAVRLTIRPHIMTLLRKSHDVVQRFDSDEMEISWSEGQLEDMLYRRIRSFEGTDHSHQLSLDIVEQYRKKNSAVRQQVLKRYFDDFDVSFNVGKTSDFRALYTLSFFRPRWLIELCAMALSEAEGDRATLSDFKIALEKFGSKLVQNLCGEHNSQIPNLEAIINQIIGSRRVKLGSGEGLKNLITQRVIDSGIVLVEVPAGGKRPDIDAARSRVALDIAKNLFMIEFIRAHQAVGGKDDHRFYRYQDRPSLLSSWSNEPHITWQLHPTFSRVLNVEDSGVYRVHGVVQEFGRRGRKRKDERETP